MKSSKQNHLHVSVWFCFELFYHSNFLDDSYHQCCREDVCEYRMHSFFCQSIWCGNERKYTNPRAHFQDPDCQPQCCLKNCHANECDDCTQPQINVDAFCLSSQRDSHNEEANDNNNRDERLDSRPNHGCNGANKKEVNPNQSCNDHIMIPLMLLSCFPAVYICIRLRRR